jgi:hypothetical protein
MIKMRLVVIAALLLFLFRAETIEAENWKLAEENGKQTQRIIKACNRHAQGWLSHADNQSGLLPRRVAAPREDFWNAKDCAADNFPFIVLTAEITDNYYLRLASQHVLDQEQKLCNRLGPLPDDFDFETQGFRTETIDLEYLVFCASEYCKDGLMPITEWIGPGHYLDRMQELVQGILDHSVVQSPVGLIPSTSIEVNGNMMQVLSRLYWLTGNKTYKEWCLRLSDYYLLHQSLLDRDELWLRDHNCEIICGLSEAYYLASREDQVRWDKYKPKLHALLDAILASGTNEDFLLFNWFSPKTSKRADDLSDGWGYVYDAFCTVGNVDDEKRYLKAVEQALTNVHKYHGYSWEKNNSFAADGFADSIEGALNLLSRIPVNSAFEWVDSEIKYILDRQRHDGIIEGWHGDGNSVRTLLMVALWKTQGITLSPWREDLQFGAVRDDNGTIRISLKSELPWSGTLRFDHPRHRDFFHMPTNYPRINQFPEWFTVDVGESYEVRAENGEPVSVDGKVLLKYPVNLQSGKSLRLTVQKTIR